jgi:hypothetical protein
VDPLQIWILFIFFFLRHADRISLNKYALTLFRPTIDSEPTMLCLKYYRATADGWRDTSNCDTCFEENQHHVRPFCYCKLPDAYSCTICNRQPPSLHDIASHTLFSSRLKYFRLTAHTTYQAYVRAAMSKCVETEKLLSPEYPLVRAWCRFDMFSHKFHRDCPCQGTHEPHESLLTVPHITAIAMRSIVFGCRNRFRNTLLQAEAIVIYSQNTSISPISLNSRLKTWHASVSTVTSS